MSLYLITDGEYQRLKSMSEKIMAIDSETANKAAIEPEKLSFNRGVATIKIQGVLEPSRIKSYDYWGIRQTGYDDIRSQVNEAVGLGAKKIILDINSPGGNVLGMLETMKTVFKARESGIKIESITSGLMASAAYMVGSQAETIKASSEMDIIGSIGVVREMYVSSYFKDVTNHESPNKRPDVSTEEGMKAVQDELSDIYNVVMPYVAKARNTTMDKINSDWGKGGTMTAKTALARGMINMIQEPKFAGRSGATKGQIKMDMATLKAEHPDLYKAAFDAGKEAGKAEFQEMAEAHITLAETSGAVDRALEDIKAGNPVGPKVYAFHNAEGIKRAAIQARGDEAPPAVGEGEDQQAAANTDKEKQNDEEIKAAYAAVGLEVEL